MKRNIIITLLFGGLLLSSCVKNEECVCDNSGNITESEAKDAGVTLVEACDFAKNTADDTCKIE